MSRSILSGVCAVALAATTACAQENPLPQSGDGEEGASVRLTPAIIDAAQVTTRTDAELYAASEFKQADLDQNGSVDENEFIAYAAVKAPLEDAPAGDMADGMAALEGEPEGDAAGPASAEEQFAEISKGDDAITETDMVEARVADFEAADANKDDVLDDAERAQFASLVSLKAAQTSL